MKSPFGVIPRGLPEDTGLSMATSSPTRRQARWRPSEMVMRVFSGVELSSTRGTTLGGSWATINSDKGRGLGTASGSPATASEDARATTARAEKRKRGMRTHVRVPLVIFNPIWFVAGVHRIIRLLVILAAAAVVESSAAPPPEIKRPPVGDNCEVEVRRGSAVSIPLKAYEGNGRPLKYEMVSEPEYGRLSDFVQADDNSQGFASVVYTHGDDEVSRLDSFSFKAKAGLGGGVSRAIKRAKVVKDEALLKALAAAKAPEGGA